MADFVPPTTDNVAPAGEWTPPTTDGLVPADGWAPPASDELKQAEYVPSKSNASLFQKAAEGRSGNPQYDPRATMDGTTIGRVLDAMGKGAVQGYGDEPLWLTDHASNEELVKAGLFNDFKSAVINPIKAFNRIAITSAAAGLDLLFRRAPGTVIGALSSGVGQVAQETGLIEPDRKAALTRDTNEFMNVALLALGSEPVYMGLKPREEFVIPKTEVKEVPVIPEKGAVTPSAESVTAAAKINAELQAKHGIIETPKTGAVAEAAPAVKATVSALPKELSGAKPRYNVGTEQYVPQFENDVDKALFITSQTKKSKADSQYRDWLKGQGYTDEEITAQGKIVRQNIKDIALTSEAGDIKIPSIATEPAAVSASKVTKEAPAPAATEPTIETPATSVTEAPAAAPTTPSPTTKLTRVAPTFEEFRQQLPKDADGYPDVAGVGSKILDSVAPGKAFRDMTDAEKISATQAANAGWAPKVVETRLETSVTLEAAPPKLPPKPKVEAPKNPADENVAMGDLAVDHEGNINLARIKDRESVEALLTEVANSHDQFFEARRGKMSLVQIAEIAEASGLTFDDVYRASENGNNILLAENHTALRAMFIQAAVKTQEAAAKFAETGLDKDNAAYELIKSRLHVLQETVAANTAEVARTTSSMRILAGEFELAGDITAITNEAGVVDAVKVIEAVAKVEDHAVPGAVEAALKEAKIPNPKEVAEAIKTVEMPKEPKEPKAEPVKEGEAPAAPKPKKPKKPVDPEKVKEVSTALDKAGLTSKEARRLEARRVSRLTSPAATAKAGNRLRNKEGKVHTLTDMALELGINLMLSNPVTHAKNIMSNSLVSFMRPVETTGAALWDAGRSALTGKERDVFFGEAAGQAFGIFQGFPEGLKAAWLAIKDEKPTVAGRKIETSTHQAIPGMLGHVVRSPGTALMAADEVFKAMASRGSINAQAYKIASKAGLRGKAFSDRVSYLTINPTEAMLKKAGQDAAYQTFTNELGRTGKFVMAALESEPVVKFVVAPFVRTPTNVIKYSLERTPFAPLSKTIRANMSGANGAEAQATAMSRMLLGAGVMTTIVKLASQGKITGGGPDPKKDPQAYDAWTMSGKKPYSVQIGHAWYPMNWLEPLATQLGIAADAYEIHGRIGIDEAKDIGGLLMYSLGNNILNKSWMQGAMGAFQAVEDYDRFGDSFLSSMLGRIVPSGVAEYTREQDPYLHEARNLTDSLRSKWPTTSESVAYKYDIFGNKIKRPEQVGPALLSPVFKSQINDDPVVAGLIAADAWPAKLDDKLKGVQLTPEESSAYQQMSGKELYNRLYPLVTMPGWDQMSVGLRRDFLRQVIEGSRRDAAQLFLADNPRILNQATQDKLQDIMDY